jgi:hypothetical protein
VERAWGEGGKYESYALSTLAFAEFSIRAELQGRARTLAARYKSSKEPSLSDQLTASTLCPFDSSNPGSVC